MPGKRSQSTPRHPRSPLPRQQRVHGHPKTSLAQGSSAAMGPRARLGRKFVVTGGIETPSDKKPDESK